MLGLLVARTLRESMYLVPTYVTSVVCHPAPRGLVAVDVINRRDDVFRRWTDGGKVDPDVVSHMDLLLDSLMFVTAD